MSPSANKPIKTQGNSSGKDHSSAWISTEESPQDIGVNFGAQQGSSAQATDFVAVRPGKKERWLRRSDSGRQTYTTSAPHASRYSYQPGVDIDCVSFPKVRLTAEQRWTLAWLCLLRTPMPVEAPPSTPSFGSNISASTNSG